MREEIGESVLEVAVEVDGADRVNEAGSEDSGVTLFLTAKVFGRVVV